MLSKATVADATEVLRSWSAEYGLSLTDVTALLERLAHVHGSKSWHEVTEPLLTEWCRPGRKSSADAYQ